MSGEIDADILELSELLAAAKDAPRSLDEWDAGDDHECRSDAASRYGEGPDR